MDVQFVSSKFGSSAGCTIGSSAIGSALPICGVSHGASRHPRFLKKSSSVAKSSVFRRRMTGSRSPRSSSLLMISKSMTGSFPLAWLVEGPHASRPESEELVFPQNQVVVEVGTAGFPGATVVSGESSSTVSSYSSSAKLTLTLSSAIWLRTWSPFPCPPFVQLWENAWYLQPVANAFSGSPLRRFGYDDHIPCPARWTRVVAQLLRCQ